MISEPTPIETVKTVMCPKCRHSYYVDLHTELKEKVQCPFCKAEVRMAYQEPARLCSCDNAFRQDADAGRGQHTEMVKVAVLLHYRMMNGKHRIQIDPPKAMQKTGLFRRHCQHAVMYINPMPIPATKKYKAELVKITEIKKVE